MEDDVGGFWGDVGGAAAIDENAFADNEAREIDIDDTAPAMSNDYYENVERFLSRAPPKLNIDKKSKTKSKREIEQEVEQEIKQNTLPALPQISQKKVKARDDLPPRPVVPTAKSKVAAALHTQTKKAANKEIDANLLMQAFNYVANIANQDIDEGGVVEDSRRQSHSAPERISPDKVKEPSKYSTAEKKGVVKKLRSKTQSREEIGGFAVSAASLEEEGKKGQLDFDALVENFEQGLTLQKLRAELNNSQESMAKSEEFMRQLAREFGGISFTNNTNSGNTKVKSSKSSGQSSKR